MGKKPRKGSAAAQKHADLLQKKPSRKSACLPELVFFEIKQKSHQKKQTADCKLSSGRASTTGFDRFPLSSFKHF